MGIDISAITKDRVFLLDGAMGTMLQKAGLPGGVLPEIYNITHPEVVTGIHSQYAAAGSMAVTANTFQANRVKLKGSGYGVDEIVSAALSCAAKSGAQYKALDVGPIGALLEPVGGLAFEDAVNIFAEQMLAGEKYGADFIIIETFSDLYEMKAAILAAKENTSLPIIATLTFQSGEVTFMGCDAKTAAVTLGVLGVAALGVNCSLGPNELAPIVDELLEYSPVPVIVQANAGLPVVSNGETYYAVKPDEYAASVAELVKAGVRIIGGCCGTDPEYISKLNKAVAGIQFESIRAKKYTAVSSGSKTVFLNDNITVIGERINPSGRSDLIEAITSGDMETLAYEAADQDDEGCDLLDVNISAAGVDEPSVMADAVKAIQGMTRLPLVLDSPNPAVLEAGARVYNGRPVLNSLTGAESSMEAVFPIAKKYGALVIGLTIDENGIPDTAEKRYEIAEKIVNRALKHGIPAENIIIDCLVSSSAVEPGLALETLKAVRLIKNSLGVLTVLGISNISYGLPEREPLNSIFLAAALGAGLDAAILNPASKRVGEVLEAFKSFRKAFTE